MDVDSTWNCTVYMDSAHIMRWNDEVKITITLKKKDSKLWYWEVFHIPTTRKNKERWQDRISKIRNEPIKSGTDLNDITEWGEYEVNDESFN